MKRRKKKPLDLLDVFQTTCGWCGKVIPPGTEVFGGSGKVRPGVDLSQHEGQVLPIRLVTANRIVLIAVSAPDSDARRAGEDFLYMACSEACAYKLREAFQADIALGGQSTISES